MKGSCPRGPTGLLRHRQALAGGLLALRNRHFVALDAAILLAAPALALLLRLERLDVPAALLPGLVVYTMAGLVVRLAIFYFMGLYGRYWLYASIDDLVQIALAVLVSAALLSALVLALEWVTGLVFAHSVPIIGGLLVLSFSGGARFLVRFGHSHRRPPQQVARRSLIFGAGDCGSMIAREMQTKPQLGFRPVAFLDDDPAKHRMRIYGLPVLGGRGLLQQMIQTGDIDCVIIAMPSAPGPAVREIAGACDLLQVEKKIMPAFAEMLDGRFGVDQLRDVGIQDLLRRKPVRTDVEVVRRALAGRRVLVTGGGGSIGSELCRQVLYCRPQALFVLGHGENSVFETIARLKRLAVDEVTIRPIIADIRFRERIHSVFEQTRPELVFHAAAHKHVPLMEANPAEAVSNNILGTQVLLEAAEAQGVTRFVLISTDKAVNPVSVMGVSKRVAELLVQRAALCSGRAYLTVRFGNVLGSRGSVLPTFKGQIAGGGPLTVTHPEATRYFMTIPEAVQLVLQAAVLGGSGDVLVLDMGQPVRIADLARDLIALSGLRPDVDIAVEYVGLRPGEKLHEELFARGEVPIRTGHEQIFIVNGAKGLRLDGLESRVASLVEAARQDNRQAVYCLLADLVPEYAPASQSRQAGAATMKDFLPATNRIELVKNRG